MPEIQRSESIRTAGEGEAGDLPAEVHSSSLVVETHVTATPGHKPAERSVSFNRDVHVKRIGRGAAPRVTAALASDGEGRLIATPVRKESITSRSKEDLALEAALVLEQVGSVNCVARDNRRLPDKFSTLPAPRRSKKRAELPLTTRRRSEEIGATTTTTTTTTNNDDVVETPRAKKKALDRSASDADSRRLKGPLAKFFSPKLERKRNSPTVKRSASDAGATTSGGGGGGGGGGAGGRGQRKRSGSAESESSSHQNGSRAKKPLSPIIEASPQVDRPFDFGPRETDPKKSRNDFEIIERETAALRREATVTEILASKPPKSPTRRRPEIAVTSPAESPTGRRVEREVDEVDEVAASGREMLHSSRYDQLQQQQHGGGGEESTIHKMIHRLTVDRSPPPQLTRTMVSPSPGFGHNNNRPFSYTRPNSNSNGNNNNNNNNSNTNNNNNINNRINNNSTADSGNLSPSPTLPRTSVIYAQVQVDGRKKSSGGGGGGGSKTQARSHSDSDEGLGLERKDSSRENSPAEKEYRRASDYTSYGNDLRRNEINSYESSRYVVDSPRRNVSSTAAAASAAAPHSADLSKSKFLGRNGAADRPAERYTSTVFVDTSDRGTADGRTDSRRRDDVERFASKTSELSARRDLLESRIKSRIHTDDIFAKKKTEHEIIDRPIVPSPITPNGSNGGVAAPPPPKRYTDTYITETRTNSNGEKYIFEKEIHEDNGKVYGYEKKITNKIAAATDATYVEPKPRDGYTVETKTDKYGDKYIVETRTHDSFADGEAAGAGGFKPFLSDKSRNSPDDRYPAAAPSHYGSSSNRFVREESRQAPSKIRERKFSRSEDFLDRDVARPMARDVGAPRVNKSFEYARGMSKSTQRLDEVGENSRVKALRSEYVTRSHENLSTADYVNARDLRRPPSSPRRTTGTTTIDDYDTDISQMTNSQLESSKYYRETRTTQRYSAGRPSLNDEYDSSPPPRGRNSGPAAAAAAGYSSSRYDSDTTGRDSVRRETSGRYVEESSSSRSAAAVRKDHRKLHDAADPKKPLRRSRNRLDYFDDSDARDSPARGGGGGKYAKERLETFDESPTMAPRVYHETKIRHSRHETRGHAEHHQRRHRETRLSDPDRKDRLADSGIENDYRRDSQEADRREALESEDEGFVTLQFIKHERRHTDGNMNLTPAERRKYDKYTLGAKNEHRTILGSKPPTGADKKYEKKVAKKSGTMSKVKQLFSKKEKKAKEEKSKSGKGGGSGGARSGSSGALTDDEVTMRYREYRGDQLRSARSARDLESDINQEDYSQRRRLSTPSGSPSPARPARLSRSTGTLTREEEPFCELNNTLTRENQGQEAERKGWFKSLSRKNKTSSKPVDKKPRIPESEILTTGTEDEEASYAPERVSVQKNLRFFGDTDQESVSSNRERSRSKRADEAATLRRDAISTSRQNLNVVSPPRKPPRLAESALSSGESTTGDSSQQSQNSQRSQRSVVYLHAATVGEIPGPNERRRAASRDELNRPLQSHTKTVSRSVSVLAPWRPRHYREPFEINYDQQQQQQQQHQKPPTTMRRRQRSRETLNRRGKEPRRGKDNLSKTGTISRSTLKSKDKQKVDRTVSTESLASKPRNGSSRTELSRSTSVPRDPNKGAGWFKIKSKKSRA